MMLILQAPTFIMKQVTWFYWSLLHIL